MGLWDRIVHYSQQPSYFKINADDHPFVRVRGTGFVSEDMLRSAMSNWAKAFAEEEAPVSLLIDLRNVAGYDARCGTLVRSWIRRAHSDGVRRIALVTGSSVLRTATRMMGSKVPVEVRWFGDEKKAKGWLAGHDTGFVALD